ncbi:MAG: LysR substrate-binding domain-containing protein [Pseudomonadaceae bacterium]|nr:LysR substrate-binding domain-containing protein [Pseudomonadaceae bacterium]
MRLDRFDLNLLVIFEAIYSEGGLTRAAQRLNMAQPTVSNSLARLREAYNDPLFARAGRGVVPTPFARRMISPVRQALRQMQATLDGNLQFDPATSDRLFRISIGEIPGVSILPPLMQALREQAPGVRLQVYQTDRREIKEALALGTLDLAIDIPQLSARALNSHTLGGGDYVCVLRKGHKCARGKMTLERFLSLQVISVSSRPSGSSMLELALNRINRRMEPVLRTQYYLPSFKIVESTDYAMVAPRSLAQQFDVAIKELPFETNVSSSCVYWHRSAEDDPANLWLRSQIIP